MKVAWHGWKLKNMSSESPSMRQGPLSWPRMHPRREVNLWKIHPKFAICVFCFWCVIYLPKVGQISMLYIILYFRRWLILFHGSYSLLCYEIPVQKVELTKTKAANEVKIWLNDSDVLDCVVWRHLLRGHPHLTSNFEGHFHIINTYLIFSEVKHTSTLLVKEYLISLNLPIHTKVGYDKWTPL